MVETTAGSSAGLRVRLRGLLERRAFQIAIAALIVVNALVLGLETSESAMAAAEPLLVGLDSAVLAVFVVELGLKLFAYGWRFFRDPWNLFDSLVVGIALFPATGNLSILRALRVLRVLRLISAVPSMRRVVTALLSAIPGLGSIFALLSLIYYVFAVMATKLFGERFPEWFGTLGESAYSLFQIMTLESWSMGIVRPVMEVYPGAWAFFVPFILVTSFTVLNLFIAIIVNAMQSQHDADLAEVQAEERAAQKADSAALLAELRALRDDVAALKRSAGVD